MIWAPEKPPGQADIRILVKGGDQHIENDNQKDFFFSYILHGKENLN